MAQIKTEVTRHTRKN